MNYGNRIYELRKQKGLSQESIAHTLGVSRQSVSLWETNQASPSMDNLISLAKVFEVSIDELVGLSDSSSNDVNPDDIKFEISYEEDKKNIYQRDCTHLNSIYDHVMFDIVMGLFAISAYLFFSASNMIFEVAQSFLIIGFLCILFGLLIYLLYVYLKINYKYQYKQKIKLIFTDNYLSYLTQYEHKEISYELIKYYIEKKKYIVIYLYKGDRIYVPDTDQNFKSFIESKAESKRRYL